ncbi:MAG TPA: LysE family translocator [Blastocatellia bacterium]|nr:LysE family translocator [Blastocatellia bacterium]
MFENFSIFLIATVTLNLTPGPDMMYVLARSVGQGRKAGIVSVLGGSTGRLLHTFAAAFGLSALLLSSPVAFDVIKYAGAIYLVYLGVRALIEREALAAVAEIEQSSLRRIYGQGFLTNALNPTVALFFLAFLPQFVDAGRGAVVGQMVLLGLIFTASATFWSTSIALLAGSVGNWLRRHPGAARAQRKVMGCVFIALGLRLAF